MYVCVYEYECVYIFVPVCVCAHELFACACVYVRVCGYGCEPGVCVCVFVHDCVCIVFYVCVCVFVNAYSSLTNVLGLNEPLCFD